MRINRNIFQEIVALGHDEDFMPVNQCEPTNAKPGSIEKIKVMIERLERGETICCDGDNLAPMTDKEAAAKDAEWKVYKKTWTKQEKVAYVIATCVVCGAEFNAPRRCEVNKTCSSGCYSRLQSSKAQHRPQEIRVIEIPKEVQWQTCEVCGHKFEKNRMTRKRKTCGRRCLRILASRNALKAMWKDSFDHVPKSQEAG